MGAPLFSSGSVCERAWILSLCSVCRVSPLYSFLPSPSLLFGREGLRLRWRQHWWGGGGGSDGGGGGREEGRERVTCWTTFLCSCGGWCRLGGGGQSRIIIALQGIMNGPLFAGLLCPHLFATASAGERNGGRDKERQRDKDTDI